MLCNKTGDHAFSLVGMLAMTTPLPTLACKPSVTSSCYCLLLPACLPGQASEPASNDSGTGSRAAEPVLSDSGPRGRGDNSGGPSSHLPYNGWQPQQHGVAAGSLALHVRQRMRPQLAAVVFAIFFLGPLAGPRGWLPAPPLPAWLQKGLILAGWWLGRLLVRQVRGAAGHILGRPGQASPDP